MQTSSMQSTIAFIVVVVLPTWGPFNGIILGFRCLVLVCISLNIYKREQSIGIHTYFMPLKWKSATCSFTKNRLSFDDLNANMLNKLLNCDANVAHYNSLSPSLSHTLTLLGFSRYNVEWQIFRRSSELLLKGKHVLHRLSRLQRHWLELHRLQTQHSSWHHPHHFKKHEPMIQRVD